MDKLSVIEKIGTILSDLKEQQEYFSRHLESLNEVEVELFAASANYLAEYAKVLKKFPVSRTEKPMAAPRAAAQAVNQEDDSLRQRLEAGKRFEEDDKQIHHPGASERPKPQIKEEPLSQHLREASGERQASQEKAGEKTGEKSDVSREAIAGAFLSPEAASGVPKKPVSPAPEEPFAPAPEKPVTPAPEKPVTPSPERPSAPVWEKPSTPVWEKPSTPTWETPSPSPQEKPGESGADKAAPERPSAPGSERPSPRAPEEPSASFGTPSVPAPDGPFSPPAREPATSAGEEQVSPARQEHGQGAPQGPSESEIQRKLSLNERFGAKKPALYERFPPKQPEQQAAGSPITNLGRSIGINERYYFIKTLFNDDKVAFDQAITRIDMCHSLGEALEYTNRSLSGKYNWGRKEEDARKFYDLLKRRFV